MDRINRIVLLDSPKALEYADAGVLEYWSTGVLKRDINPAAITQ
jgi:hypothetical protein